MTHLDKKTRYDNAREWQVRRCHLFFNGSAKIYHADLSPWIKSITACEIAIEKDSKMQRRQVLRSKIILFPFFDMLGWNSGSREYRMSILLLGLQLLRLRTLVIMFLCHFVTFSHCHSTITTPFFIRHIRNGGSV